MSEGIEYGNELEELDVSRLRAQIQMPSPTHFLKSPSMLHLKDK